LKKDHVPRPMNSFMLFRKVVQRRGGVRRSGFQEFNISKGIGDVWRKLIPKNMKDEWTALAVLSTQLHRETFPTYKYTPDRSRAKPIRRRNINFRTED